jgi:hypothetical protein
MMNNDHEEPQIPGGAESAPAAPQDPSGPDTQVPVDHDFVDEPSAPEAGFAATSAPTQTVEAPKPPPSLKPIPDEEDVPKDDPSKYTGYKWPEGDNPHVAEVQPVFHEMPADWPKDDPSAISAIPCNATTFNELLDAYPSLNYGVGELSREWAAEITRAATSLHQGEFLTGAANRDGSKWSQRVPYGAGQLGITRPPVPKGSGDGKMSGDMTSLRVKAELGIGVRTNVPLWHSGFWVTVRAPSARARLELQQRLDMERIELGRTTAGLAFSNTSVYLKSYLVDFALAHVSSTNAAVSKMQDLKDRFLSTDIPQLIWGILTTLYPHGYPYHQPCINDPSKCQHIVKEVIDLNKISFTDLQCLSQAQLKHMSERNEKKTDEQIKAYQEAHAYLGKGLIDVKTRYGSIKMQLKVPTFTQYASAGFAWVDGIEATIIQAFGTNLQGEQRNAYILDQAKSLSMGEYSHWVQQIGFNDGTVVEDVDTIRNILGEISGDSDLSQSFFTQVMKFMEQCTLSMVAIPQYNCPQCGTPSVPKDSIKHPYLNPLDVEALFFTTLGQHIEKVLS